MSFLGKIKSGVKVVAKTAAKTAVKATVAPIKLQAKAVGKIATAAAKITALPTKALLKITPSPLKKIVKLATIPLSLPLAVAPKTLKLVARAANKVAAKPAAKPAAKAPPKPAAKAPPRPVLVKPAAKPTLVTRMTAAINPSAATSRGVPPSAPSAPMAPMLAKVVAAINPSSTTAYSPPEDAEMPPAEDPLDVETAAHAEDAAPADEPAGGDGGEGYDSGNVGPEATHEDYPVEGGGDENAPDVGSGQSDAQEEGDPVQIMGLDDYMGAFEDMDLADEARSVGDVLGDWKSELKAGAKTIGKQTASIALNTVANRIIGAASPSVSVAPHAAEMSMPTKIAIGVALGVPLLYLFTKKKSPA